MLEITNPTLFKSAETALNLKRSKTEGNPTPEYHSAQRAHDILRDIKQLIGTTNIDSLTVRKERTKTKRSSFSLTADGKKIAQELFAQRLERYAIASADSRKDVDEARKYGNELLSDIDAFDFLLKEFKKSGLDSDETNTQYLMLLRIKQSFVGKTAYLLAQENVKSEKSIEPAQVIDKLDDKLVIKQSIFERSGKVHSWIKDSETFLKNENDFQFLEKAHDRYAEKVSAILGDIGIELGFSKAETAEAVAAVTQAIEESDINVPAVPQALEESNVTVVKGSEVRPTNKLLQRIQAGFKLAPQPALIDASSEVIAEPKLTQEHSQPEQIPVPTLLQRLTSEKSGAAPEKPSVFANHREALLARINNATAEVIEAQRLIQDPVGSQDNQPTVLSLILEENERKANEQLERQQKPSWKDRIKTFAQESTKALLDSFKRNREKVWSGIGLLATLGSVWAGSAMIERNVTSEEVDRELTSRKSVASAVIDAFKGSPVPYTFQALERNAPTVTESPEVPETLVAGSATNDADTLIPTAAQDKYEHPAAETVSHTPETTLREPKPIFHLDNGEPTTLEAMEQDLVLFVEPDKYKVLPEASFMLEGSVRSVKPEEIIWHWDAAPTSVEGAMATYNGLAGRSREGSELPAASTSFAIAGSDVMQLAPMGPDKIVQNVLTDGYYTDQDKTTVKGSYGINIETRGLYFNEPGNAPSEIQNQTLINLTIRLMDQYKLRFTDVTGHNERSPVVGKIDPSQEYLNVMRVALLQELIAQERFDLIGDPDTWDFYKAVIDPDQGLIGKIPTQTKEQILEALHMSETAFRDLSGSGTISSVEAGAETIAYRPSPFENFVDTDGHVHVDGRLDFSPEFVPEGMVSLHDTLHSELVSKLGEDRANEVFGSTVLWRGNSEQLINHDAVPALADFLTRASDAGYKVVILHTYRSYEEQDHLHTVNPTGAATPGASTHQGGYTLDMNIEVNGEYLPFPDDLVGIAREAGLIQPLAQDRPHFVIVKGIVGEENYSEFLELLEHDIKIADPNPKNNKVNAFINDLVVKANGLDNGEAEGTLIAAN